MLIVLCIIQGFQKENELNGVSSRREKLREWGRKGFSVLELVIVIAVTAILALVLIPVIFNLVGKAAIAADTETARKTDIALKIYDIDGPADIERALEDAGISPDSLVPQGKGNAFYYDESECCVVLYGSEGVIYPEYLKYKYTDMEELPDEWIAISHSKEATETAMAPTAEAPATTEAPIETEAPIITEAPSTTEAFVTEESAVASTASVESTEEEKETVIALPETAAFSDILALLPQLEAGSTICLGGDMYAMPVYGEELYGDLIIDLNGHTFSMDMMINCFILCEGASVTVKNGSITSSCGCGMECDCPAFHLRDGATLSLVDVVWTTDCQYGIRMDASGAAAKLENCDIAARSGLIYVTEVSEGAVICVSGCDITSGGEPFALLGTAESSVIQSSINGTVYE